MGKPAKICGITKPDDWPDDYVWSTNPWYNSYRFRASEAFRMVACTASISLPRTDWNNLTKASKAKTQEGTDVHALAAEGKLKDQNKIIGPYVPAQHEVDVAYRLGVGPMVAQKFESDEAYHAYPRRRQEIIGRIDFHQDVAHDLHTNRVITDIKTSKELKSDGFYQAGIYYQMLPPLDHPAPLQATLWHIRTRISRICKPEEFGLSNASITIVAARLLATVHQVYQDGPASVSEPTPGPHCGFCPARFACPAYERGYVYPKPGPLRKWLQNEIAEYEQHVVETTNQLDF